MLSSIIGNLADPVGKTKIEINKLKRDILIRNAKRRTIVWERVYIDFPCRFFELADDRQRKGSGRRSLMSIAKSVDGELRS